MAAQRPSSFACLTRSVRNASLLSSALGEGGYRGLARSRVAASTMCASNFWTAAITHGLMPLLSRSDGFNIRVWIRRAGVLVFIFLILVLGSNENIGRKIIVPAEAGPPLGAQ